MIGLLAESEDVREEHDDQEQADDLDGLFDDDDDEQEEYNDGTEEDKRDVDTEDAVSELFGDVNDIENEDKKSKGKEAGKEACGSLDRSREDLQGLWQCSIYLNVPLVGVASRFWFSCRFLV